MLLANGHTVYFGPAKSASQYFVSIGYPIPKDYNIADYLSKLLNLMYCWTIIEWLIMLYIVDLTMNRPAPSSATPQPQSRPSRRIPFLTRRIPSSSSIVSTRSLEELHPSNPNNDEGNSSDDADGIISDTVQRMSQSGPSFAGDMDLISDSNNLYTLLEAYKNSGLASSIRAHIESVNGSVDAGSTRSQPYSLLMTYYSENAPSISLRRYFHELVGTVLQFHQPVTLYM